MEGAQGSNSNSKIRIGSIKMKNLLLLLGHKPVFAAGLLKLTGAPLPCDY